MPIATCRWSGPATRCRIATSAIDSTSVSADPLLRSTCAELVATYLRRYQGRSTRMEHYPEPAQAFLRASPQACLRKAESIGPATHQLVRELLLDHALHHLRQAQGVLRLVDRFGVERLERACQRALDAGDGRYRTVRGILERGADQLQPDDELPAALRQIGAFLRGPAAFARSLLEVH